MKTIFIMILISILLVAAQISLKNSLLIFSKGFKFELILNLLLNTNFLISIALIFLASILWMYVLSYEKISIVYPFMSLSYIFMMIYAHYFLHEFVTPIKIIGMIFLTIGLTLIYQ